MTFPLPNPRYERKFIAQGFTLTEVLARVRRHPAVFREAYPARVVNNLYLDSPARRDYHEHVNGAANRSKTRVRWYGPEFAAAEKPRLERKLKRGLVSGKEAHSLPRLILTGDGLGSRLEAAFDTVPFPDGLRVALRCMEPALFNRYRRYYFVSCDRKFRLTVDCHLQYADVASKHRAAIKLSSPATTPILELKFGPEVADEAQVITNALPFRVARFSKYVAGCDQLRV